MGESEQRTGDTAVLYDADCGFCKWSLNWILRWDRRRRLRPVPIQSEEGQKLLAPVPEDDRLDSWHLVLPDGSVSSAGAGLPVLARRLPGGRPLARVLETFPGTTERAYRAVAANRSRLARMLRIDSSCDVRR
jgi:predicted DCC family thiol-disulfide oxidoreductase YuxK